MKTIYVLNGPNLNLLGTREPETYGTDTLATIEQLCRSTAAELECRLEFRQTNHEGEMIDWIQQTRGKADALVINPAAWTHTSVAIRDAVTAVALPLFEVHITNVHKREPFRHHSYLSDVANGVICGFGIQGYRYALMQAAQL
ncbi:type II 3-dehydroquinate dehydratase [Serratia proteamaculans]|uniref:type II 3-dehydroquinate dehydratase n=1 Tax=Serratia TaxID=613 RepID=UPI001575C5F3|nr:MULTISPECIES: type II 3-dehydroquinate dehydratase [Serratia]NTX78426.1 type II 3-dehydroquinate dehydratase [Serratia proteamaculans]NTZ27332.1 type II 3-dehydroquinate dehydratase [Serratia proteamaculans]CAI0700505.1 3-dehydroquinate dehydratase [Serratia quinivorans]CAI0747523.1 3-dehydroquinate dehydratase [Serratia quinivorans]CAI0866101.1 3-dehydroquinate dehydratase [Serratia quinivorans]